MREQSLRSGPLTSCVCNLPIFPSSPRLEGSQSFRGRRQSKPAVLGPFWECSGQWKVIPAIHIFQPATGRPENSGLPANRAWAWAWLRFPWRLVPSPPAQPGKQHKLFLTMWEGRGSTGSDNSLARLLKSTWKFTHLAMRNEWNLELEKIENIVYWALQNKHILFFYMDCIFYLRTLQVLRVHLWFSKQIPWQLNTFASTNRNTRKAKMRSIQQRPYSKSVVNPGLGATLEQMGGGPSGVVSARHPGITNHFNLPHTLLLWKQMDLPSNKSQQKHLSGDITSNYLFSSFCHRLEVRKAKTKG